MKKVLTANQALKRVDKKPMEGCFTTYLQRAGPICISEGLINMLKPWSQPAAKTIKMLHARNTEAPEPAMARRTDAEVSQIQFNILGRMCARFHERAGYRFQRNVSFSALQKRKEKKNVTFSQQTAKTLWERIKEPADEEELRLLLFVGNSLGRLFKFQIQL